MLSAELRGAEWFAREERLNRYNDGAVGVRLEKIAASPGAEELVRERFAVMRREN